MGPPQCSVNTFPPGFRLRWKGRERYQAKSIHSSRSSESILSELLSLRLPWCLICAPNTDVEEGGPQQPGLHTDGPFNGSTKVAGYECTWPQCPLSSRGLNHNKRLRNDGHYPSGWRRDAIGKRIEAAYSSPPKYAYANEQSMNGQWEQSGRLGWNEYHQPKVTFDVGNEAPNESE